MRCNPGKVRLGVFLLVLLLLVSSCGTSAKGKYYGKTVAPNDGIVRYVTGSEPRSLDPAVGTGQPEARIYMALFDGLVEYHPKDMSPIPALAESWEVSSDATEYLFHLRKNAKFSDGTPITANDFVYSFRRALSPELAAENAVLAFFIKYSEAYNGGDFFLKNSEGKLLFASDFEDSPQPTTDEKTAGVGLETDFAKEIRSPLKMIVSHDNLKLAQTIEKNPKLKEYFKFKISDLKNAFAFVDRLKKGTDGLSLEVKRSISDEVLNQCSETACTDSIKQQLIDGLNKTIDGDSLFGKDWFAGLQLKSSTKFAEQITVENKKRAEANVKIDEEAAKLTNAEEKEAKLKGKKQPIGKLQYINKFVLDEAFSPELEKSGLVAVKAEDLGAEAIDDYKFRITLTQPAPYFLGLLAHQFFKVVPKQTIEKYGKEWTRPENIVTSGAFKVAQYRPYDTLNVTKDENNWDAANVKLKGIEFYPLEDQTTMMNLYKAGAIDAIYNHTVPPPWIREIMASYPDEYMNHPEAAIEFYVISVKKPPMDNVKVRQAFALSVDRKALAKLLVVKKPLVDFTPEGIFPQYEEARKKVQDVKLKELNISEEQWKNRIFDPERARKLLGEAGFAVEGSEGNFQSPKFPIENVSILYNTSESNKITAEFMQDQWKKNLGITVPLKNMEFKTFLPTLTKVEYQGFGRRGWVADYMDPFTYLGLFYTESNDGATGWSDKKYDDLLAKANRTIDADARFTLLAEAEFFMMQQQLVVPLSTAATNWMKKPYLKGFYPNPGTLHAWKFVYIESDSAKWDKDVDNIMKEKDPAVEEQLAKLISTQTQFEEKMKAETAKTATP